MREDEYEVQVHPQPLPLTPAEGAAAATAFVTFASQIGVTTATVSAATSTGHALAGMFFSAVGLFAVNRLRRSEGLRSWATRTVRRLEAENSPLVLPVRYLPVPPAGAGNGSVALRLHQPQRQPTRPVVNARSGVFALFGDDIPGTRRRAQAEDFSSGNPRSPRAAHPARPLSAAKPTDPLRELDEALGLGEHLEGPANIGPLPLKEWVPFADSRPHLMLAAKTGGGKSTLARFFLRNRIRRGEEVFIIDPHWAPHHWWGLPGAGKGENFEEIREALLAVFEEYQSRLQAYGAGKRTDEFNRLTVLVDESFLIQEYFSTARVEDDRGKLVKDDTWSRFVKVLGSGARKVRVSVILITQTTNVEDLGLSGALRENYARIALDGRTVRYLTDEDGEKARRDALRSSLRAQGDYPAAMEMNGEVFYLDRSRIVDVEKPNRAEKSLWGGWDYGTVATVHGTTNSTVDTVHGAAGAPYRTVATVSARRIDTVYGATVDRSVTEEVDPFLAELLARETPGGVGGSVAESLETKFLGVPDGNSVSGHLDASSRRNSQHRVIPTGLQNAAFTWKTASSEEKAATAAILRRLTAGEGKRDAIAAEFGPSGRAYSRGKELVDAAMLLRRGRA